MAREENFNFLKIYKVFCPKTKISFLGFLILNTRLLFYSIEPWCQKSVKCHPPSVPQSSMLFPRFKSHRYTNEIWHLHVHLVYLDIKKLLKFYEVNITSHCLQDLSLLSFSRKNSIKTSKARQKLEVPVYFDHKSPGI